MGANSAWRHTMWYITALLYILRIMDTVSVGRRLWSARLRSGTPTKRCGAARRTPRPPLLGSAAPVSAAAYPCSANCPCNPSPFETSPVTGQLYGSYTVVSSSRLRSSHSACCVSRLSLSAMPRVSQQSNTVIQPNNMKPSMYKNNE